ncbi:hypothetical protein [Thiomicrorhabdus cannonii]|uniref:hypothetical protein n=1 Tax=Thiomicrorhabdus cannonii TaxID=2748011 RepID=UPI0015BE3E49|nr:hypothetical protein [Thiomicrorhabdus cannonii]
MSSDPQSSFHPSIAEEFVAVPADVKLGWILTDGTWSAPAEVEPDKIAPVYPKVGPTTFKLLWTSPERLKLKELRATDMVIDDFYDIIEDPRLNEIDLGLTSTQDGVDYCLAKLVESGVVTDAGKATRREQILTGSMQ